MKVSTRRVVLENSTDIINYVTKGLSPSKKDFQKLKEDLSNGTIKFSDPDRNLINPNFTLEDLELIYKNKRSNEFIATIVGGVLVIVSFILGAKAGSRTSNNKNMHNNVINLNDPDVIEILDDMGFTQTDNNNHDKVRVIRF